jgi:chromate transporter
MPSFAEATRVWARIALLSFGGPAGQIAVMHRILVEEKRWIGDARFLHALNFCMLLPGPEAQQLATYSGWLLHGARGGWVAGLLFIVPGLVAIMGLSWIYVIWGEVGIVAAAFVGVKAAVLAIVLQAVVRLGSRILGSGLHRLIAAGAFIAIFAFDVPFPLVVLGAALIGLVAARAGVASARAPGGPGGGAGEVADADTVLGAESQALGSAATTGALRAGLLALFLWFLPVGLLLLVAGQGNVFTDIALFFSHMALVTFGGAYAALAYVAQEAVGTFGWLRPGEMLDGLGMAETTPGPLIMVLQFVGFLAAFRDAGWSEPLVAATLGGLLVTWVTFAPCFAWIFLGAPYIERLRGSPALGAALGAVTAAVVGVILNLAVWFAVHAAFREVRAVGIGPVSLDLPVLASIDWKAAGLAALAIVAVFRWRVGLAGVIGGGAALGIALHAVGL